MMNQSVRNMFRHFKINFSSLQTCSPNPCTNGHRRQTSQNYLCLSLHRTFSSTMGAFQKTDTAKILYDGECKICAVEISGLKRLTRSKSDVEFVDITSLDYDPSNFSGVTYEDAMKEMHVIGSDGQIYTQGDAIRHMYRVCRLGWLASLTELPVVKPFCDRLYMKFAEYRLRKALAKCDSESCSIKLHNLRNQLKESELGKR